MMAARLPRLPPGWRSSTDHGATVFVSEEAGSYLAVLVDYEGICLDHIPGRSIRIDANALAIVLDRALVVHGRLMRRLARKRVRL